MQRDANFYAVVYNGRISAYEISGKDLRVKGFQRVSRDDFFKMMEAAKRQDGVTEVKIEAKETQKKRQQSNLAQTERKIKEHVKAQGYKMTRSEWAWDYLPTV
jgi:hypothetical protein